MSDLEAARLRRVENGKTIDTEKLKQRISQLVHFAGDLHGEAADVTEVMVDLMMTVICMADVCGCPRDAVKSCFADYADHLPVLSGEFD